MWLWFIFVVQTENTEARSVARVVHSKSKSKAASRDKENKPEPRAFFSSPETISPTPAPIYQSVPTATPTNQPTSNPTVRPTAVPTDQRATSSPSASTKTNVPRAFQELLNVAVTFIGCNVNNYTNKEIMSGQNNKMIMTIETALQNRSKEVLNEYRRQRRSLITSMRNRLLVAAVNSATVVNVEKVQCIANNRSDIIYLAGSSRSSCLKVKAMITLNLENEEDGAVKSSFVYDLRTAIRSRGLNYMGFQAITITPTLSTTTTGVGKLPTGTLIGVVLAAFLVGFMVITGMYKHRRSQVRNRTDVGTASPKKRSHLDSPRELLIVVEEKGMHVAGATATFVGTQEVKNHKSFTQKSGSKRDTGSLSNHDLYSGMTDLNSFSFDSAYIESMTMISYSPTDVRLVSAIGPSLRTERSRQNKIEEDTFTTRSYLQRTDFVPSCGSHNMQPILGATVEVGRCVTLGFTETTRTDKSTDEVNSPPKMVQSRFSYLSPPSEDEYACGDSAYNTDTSQEKVISAEHVAYQPRRISENDRLKASSTLPYRIPTNEVYSSSDLAYDTDTYQEKVLSIEPAGDFAKQLDSIPLDREWEAVGVAAALLNDECASSGSTYELPEIFSLSEDEYAFGDSAYDTDTSQEKVLSTENFAYQRRRFSENDRLKTSSTLPYRIPTNEVYSSSDVTYDTDTYQEKLLSTESAGNFANQLDRIPVEREWEAVGVAAALLNDECADSVYELPENFPLSEDEYACGHSAYGTDTSQEKVLSTKNVGDLAYQLNRISNERDWEAVGVAAELMNNESATSGSTHDFSEMSHLSEDESSGYSSTGKTFRTNYSASPERLSMLDKLIDVGDWSGVALAAKDVRGAPPRQEKAAMTQDWRVRRILGGKLSSQPAIADDGTDSDEGSKNIV